MMAKRSGSITALILALVWICAVQGALAQDSVVVDGDLVRIRSGSEEVAINVDWREAAGVAASATGRFLVELGAVTIDDRIQLNLEGDILFAFDSTEIQPGAAAQLGKVAHVIRARSVGEVYVIGHTDSVGSGTYNAQLSRDRAVTVMRWLNSREAIPASVMVGSGQGAMKPIAHNTRPDGSDDPAGRARNRRVEIQIATRAGVTLGPNVTIGEGGVMVGDVSISEAGVKVGGVTIDTGGVSVGGISVAVSDGGAGAKVVDDERPVTCASGKICTYRCPGGDCDMTCKSGATCIFSCPGGDCRMSCNSGGTCNFSCSGGDCLFRCPLGGTCNVSCSGDGCDCTGPAC